MKIANLSVGQQLPIRHFKASNVSLFCYNAAIWNPHRIHYDEKYTKEIEHHPEIVIDGPLQGDWLSQTVTIGSVMMETYWSSPMKTGELLTWEKLFPREER